MSQVNKNEETKRDTWIESELYLEITTLRLYWLFTGELLLVSRST